MHIEKQIRRKIRGQLILVLTLSAHLLGAGVTQAQDDSSPILPEVLSKEMPEIQENRFGMPIEGWVKVRYSILADGSTDNVEVIDHMPPRMSTRDTEKAVEDWRFEPASVAGTAVDWHNNIEVVVFDAEDVELVSGPLFADPYQQVEELMAEEKYDRASSRSARLLRESLFNLHDIGLGSAQNARVEMFVGDLFNAYTSITRATMEQAQQLVDEELEVALQYRFALELALGRLQDALNSYEKRIALSALPEDEPMIDQAKQLQEALAAPFTMPIKARLDDKRWFHVPGSHSFSIAEVDGDIDELAITCNRTLTTLEYSEGVEWTLPESWGDCSLEVLGRNDTTFTFFEFH